MSRNFILGLDIGGTSARALLIDHEGVRVGVGRAGGANPTSHDPSTAAIRLRAALDAALADIDPARVLAGVIGLAGVGKLAADARARAAFDDAWRAAGLRCPYRLTSDALVGYASGTADPAGTVLVAGTGAVAAAVRDWQLAQVADGHGWLLGDRGSGFWLGREAVRAALAVSDGAAPEGRLARAVRVALLDARGPHGAPGMLDAPDVAGDPREVASALVQAANARPPVALAELAPVVLAAYAEDPAARSIVDTAADHLVATVALVHAERLPMVLAGGMLIVDTPLAAAVRTRVAERWPASVAHRAGDGAAAAAWLAARDLPGVDAARLHAALLPPI